MLWAAARLAGQLTDTHTHSALSVIHKKKGFSVNQCGTAAVGTHTKLTATGKQLNSLLCAIVYKLFLRPLLLVLA